MEYKSLGPTQVKVSAIGLGAMPLSIQGRPPREQGISVIHRALDLGITLIDTADAYCLDEKDKHHNERLIAEALSLYKGETSSVMVATKGGLMRPGGDWIANGNPNHIRKTIRESYQALGGIKPIPLWQLHAVDDKFSLQATLKPVQEAVEEGLIRFVGLSNVSIEEIEEARKIVEIVSIQNQYNLWYRKPEKDGVLKYCEDHGLTFLPWSPLGGMDRAKKLSDVPILKKLSAEKSASPQQLILAWLCAKSACIVPIPGASQISTLENSLKAVDLKLSEEEIARIDSIN